MLTHLGKKFVVVAGVGVLAAAVAVLAALLDAPTIALVALAAGLLALLGAAVLLKADHHRSQTALRVVRRDLRALRGQSRDIRRHTRDARRDLRGLKRQVPADVRRALKPQLKQLNRSVRADVEEALQTSIAHTVDLIAEEMERANTKVVESVGDRLAAQSARGVADTEAIYQLFARHTPRASMQARPDEPGPRSVLDLVEVVRRSGSTSVVAAYLGEQSTWLGYELAESAGSAQVLVADHGQRLKALVSAHSLDEVLSVVTAPLKRPDIPHHYLPWHDVTELGDHAVDLLVVGEAPDGPRAALPAVPLLASRLAAGARIAVVTGESAEAKDVFDYWREHHGAQVDDELTTSHVAVLRLP